MFGRSRYDERGNIRSVLTSLDQGVSCEVVYPMLLVVGLFSIWVAFVTGVPLLAMVN